MTSEERARKVEERIKADERTREIAQLEKKIKADAEFWSSDFFNWESVKRGVVMLAMSWVAERSVVWLLDTTGLLPQDPEDGEMIGSIVFWLCVTLLLVTDFRASRERKQQSEDLRKQQLEASMQDSATE